MAKSKKDTSQSETTIHIIVSDLSDENLTNQRPGQKIILQSPDGDKECIELRSIGAGICSVIG
jgi:hypothetical protein